MFQDDTTEYVSKLLDELEKHGAEVAIEEDLCAYLKSTSLIDDCKTFSHDNGLDETFDMFISLGGDGTILRATTFVKDLGIPIVGVNTGRLGFLSTFNKEEVQNVVQVVLLV